MRSLNEETNYSPSTLQLPINPSLCFPAPDQLIEAFINRNIVLYVDFSYPSYTLQGPINPSFCVPVPTVPDQFIEALISEIIICRHKLPLIYYIYWLTLLFASLHILSLISYWKLSLMA